MKTLLVVAAVLAVVYAVAFAVARLAPGGIAL